MKIHHVAIFARHVEKTAAWYRAFLGAPEKTRHQDAQGLRSIWLQLSHGVILMVERWPFDDDDPQKSDSLVAFAIEKNARTTWMEKARTMGCTVEDQTPFSFYVRDPEGRTLGLSHFPEPFEDN
jgi:catechol 2,3-dioxygenase-like lactoylglutathione lyase family enzyme